MIDDTATFSLKGGEYYVTERETDAFRILKGTVLVYIAPLKEEHIGRRSFIYEAAEGEVLPGFFYSDTEGCPWRFCFVALEQATMEVIENGATKILKESFIQRAKINNYAVEGFHGALIDQYRLNIVKEDGFIRHSQKERISASAETSEMIRDSLNKKAGAFMLRDAFQKLATKDARGISKDLIKRSDIVWGILMTVLMALTSLFLPIAASCMIDEFLPEGNRMILLPVGGVLVAGLWSNMVFSIARNKIRLRFAEKITHMVQGKVYHNLFQFPEHFYRKYESADLAYRIMRTGKVVSSFYETEFSATAAGITAGILLIGMASLSGILTIAGIGMVAIYIILFYTICAGSLRYKKSIMELERKTDSCLYQFLNGISKIRTAGVEDRAVYEYMKSYLQLRNSKEKYSTIINCGRVWSMVLNSFFSIALYLVYIHENLSIGLGAFLAFHMLFGAFSEYSIRFVEALVSAKALQPELEQIRPVLEEAPEDDGTGELPGDLAGAVRISNVTFSYGKEMPVVLHNINLTIRPGEYIAIAGPSGCGKSTLLRLMLGLEKASQGTVFFDNKDIEGLNKRELRKKMGVVLQNGTLVAGSILDNIMVTAPDATPEDVSRVVDAVGLDKDLSSMPMGLHTVLSEQCGMLSGGQKQRILIARALISNPKLLFLDEATSALDNAAQNTVCETLEKLDATRIVIAHRLSTVMRCDRIIVMDAGQIVEQGTYAELMERKGLFYRMASRQIL